ncbi:FadR/GntR family transcriptional regulator [Pseudonocardia sp.]|uniref:FadR/GntR family transcriptional regulator n=1 Tax=Pseudonocardia sp. TaxID=60912 RepID=UPI003D10BC8A
MSIDTADWSLPHDLRRPKPEVVEDKLDSLIHDGTLPWGEQLPSENWLADRLKVGRSSVRSALQRLQLRGLVEVEQGVGWWVVRSPPATAPSAEERGVAFAQTVEVRLALEGTACRLAARNATPREIKRIGEAHNEHRAAEKSGVDALVETDEAFHRAIVDAAHNPLLSRMYDMLLDEVRDHRVEVFSHPRNRARLSAHGHALVVDFLQQRDESAAAAMHSHILTFAPRLEQPSRPPSGIATT